MFLFLDKWYLLTLLRCIRLAHFLFVDTEHRAQFLYALSLFPAFAMIYCETPKAACTRIKRVLYEKMTEKKAPFNIHPIFATTFIPRLSRHIPKPLQRIIKFFVYIFMCMSSRYYRWCIVRNPYDRLVSSYLNKISEQADPLVREWFLNEIIKRYHRNPDNPRLSRDNDDTISFSEMINILAKTHHEDLEGHVARQYDVTFQSFLRYETIIKMEDMPEAIVPVMSRYGFSREEALREFSIRDNTTHRQGTLQDWYDDTLAARWC